MPNRPVQNLLFIILRNVSRYAVAFDLCNVTSPFTCRQCCTFSNQLALPAGVNTKVFMFFLCKQQFAPNINCDWSKRYVELWLASRDESKS